MNKIFFLHEPYKKKSTGKLIQKEINKNDLVIGRNIKNFENKILSINQAKYCSLVSSGTAALHLSLICNNVHKNCEVLMPSISFIASLNSILYTGAKPVFFDIDDNLNIKLDDVYDFLHYNTYQDDNNDCINIKSKKKIACIMLIHVFGNIIDYSQLVDIAKRKNIKIVEDAAEAFGSYVKVKNKRFYPGSFGSLASLSFNGNKIITSAGGGAIISKNKKDKLKIDYYSSQSKSDNLTFKHNDMGFNYRMSNIQATIGYDQAVSFKEILRKKKYIYQSYLKHLDKNLFDTIKYDIGSNYWLVVIKILKKINIINLTNYMSSRNIEVRPVWYPLHLQKYTKKFEKYKLVNAKQIHKKYLCLPSSYCLSEKNIKYICDCLRGFY